MVRIGTAGWAIPRAVAPEFPAAGTGLERYAARFDAVEINSSFHRPHRRSTYERWAASVPGDFRFAVKLPKAITHAAKLVGADALLERFAEEVAGLGERRGPILVQLPPSLVFDPEIASAFFARVDARLGGRIACEPRHPSWFEPEADALLRDHRVARVAADPARVPAAAVPGGWPGLAYFRLHGSPRIYWSNYEPDALADWAGRVARATADGTEAWAIFDNTTSGSAAGNALAFAAACSGASKR